MRHILNFKLFEKKEEKEKVENTEKAKQMIEDFKKDFGTELDERFSVAQIKLLRKAFGHFNETFITVSVDVMARTRLKPAIREIKPHSLLSLRGLM